MLRTRILPMVFILLSLAGAAAAFDVNLGNYAFQIHGYGSQGYMKSSDNDYLTGPSADGSFQFNEVAINAQSQVTDKLRVGIQILARDYGHSGNNIPIVDWVYGDYKFHDAFAFQFGKLKTPWGFFNEGRDVDMLRPMIVLPSSLYSEDIRPLLGTYIGVKPHGIIPTAIGEFEYHFGVGVTNMDADEPLIQNMFFSLGLGALKNRQAWERYIWGGRLYWRPKFLEGLTLEGEYGRSSIDYSGDMQTPYGLIPIKFNHKFKHNMVLGAKYNRGNLQLAFEFTKAITDFYIEMTKRTIKLDPMGYYLMGSYRFFDKFEVSSYYNVYYRDANDKDGKNFVAMRMPDYLAWQKDWCIAARYDFTDWFLIKAEFHKVNGTAQCHLYENQHGTVEDWNYFALKATVSF